MENRLFSKADIELAMQSAFASLVDELGYLEGCAISDFVVLFEEALEKTRVRLRTVKPPKEKDE